MSILPPVQRSDAMSDLIRSAVEAKVQQEIDREAKAAAQRVESAIRAAMAEIVMRVHSRYSVELRENQIVITVDRRDLKP